MSAARSFKYMSELRSAPAPRLKIAAPEDDVEPDHNFATNEDVGRALAAGGDARAMAHLMRARGFALCKPDPAEKKPTYRGWPTRSLEPADFAPGDTLGVIAGPLSDGNRPGHALVVVDLDSSEALRLADDHVPDTAMSEGRPGKPSGHRYFLVPCDSIPHWAHSHADQAAPAALAQKGHRGPFLKHFSHAATGAGVLDFIGTGGQVAAPPSAHPGGERRSWDEWDPESHPGLPGPPAVVTFDVLWAAVCALAGACGAAVPDVKPRAATGTVGGTTDRRSDDPEGMVVERARKYLARLDPAVSGQNGHTALLVAARVLRWGFDLPHGVALDLLRDDFNPRCRPPWNEYDLERKVCEADKPHPTCPTRGHLRDAPPPYPEPPRPYIGVTNVNGPGQEAAGAPKANAGDVGDGFRCPWGQRGPLPLPSAPPVPPFPLPVFPPCVADYWQAAADSLHVPVDYVAVPALPLLGAAIGRTRAAVVKPGYAESPIFWAVVVAPPGAAKSPSLRLAKGNLPAVNRRWREEFKERATAYQTDLAKFETEFARWKKSPDGDPPRRPERPVLRQLVVDKFTVEALCRVNADNERGIVLAQDELAGLVQGLNQYKGGRGDDKQTLLSMWAGAEVEVNRVRDKTECQAPLYIPHSFVGVCGMIQPDLLALLRGDLDRREAVNDGWADRFLLSFPDPRKLVGEQWGSVDPALAANYADMFNALLALEMVPGHDGPRPFLLPFGEEARRGWQSFTDDIAARCNALEPGDPYVGVLQKLKHYGVRFTCLLHCLWDAVADWKVSQNAIGGATMARAAELVAYFEAHGRRGLGGGWADRTNRVAQRLINWLARHPCLMGFNRRQAFQQLKDQRDVKTSDALTAPLKLLADYGYVRPSDEREAGKPGPSPEVYLVNPNWDRKPRNPSPTSP